MAGLTLDSGALIAYERGAEAVRAWLTEAFDREQPPTVPTVVIAQVWRSGKNARIAQLLKTCEVEDLDKALARAAGELLGKRGTADVVDAIVVVSAARRGDVVLTSDPDDLSHLAELLPQVHVRSIAP